MISLYNAGVSLGSIKATSSRLVAQYRLDYELSRTKEHCFCESTIGNIFRIFQSLAAVWPCSLNKNVLIDSYVNHKLISL